MNSIDLFLEAARALLAQFGAQVAVFLPKLFLALLVVAAGWLLARLAMLATVRALRAINLNVLTERAGLDEFMREGGVQSDPARVFGYLAWWVVMLAALHIAAGTLGLPYVADALARLLAFLPKVLVALLILIFGAYFARIAGAAVGAYCRAAGVPDEELIARLARYAVLAFVLLIALDELDIGGRVVRESFLIVLAGVVLALALAFGLGARRWAEALIERWWPTAERKDGP
jgi:hypothetical protein